MKHFIQGRNNGAKVGFEPSNLAIMAIVKTTLQATAPCYRHLIGSTSFITCRKVFNLVAASFSAAESSSFDTAAAILS